jgi:serine/threonine protein kinase
MFQTPLSAFELLEELPQGSSGDVSVWRARSTEDPSDLRLTLFSAAKSAITGFRSAFRKDLTTLSESPHDNVPEMKFWGEHKGQLFFVTEMPGGVTLDEQIDAGDSRSWDELADIGWQIASVLQHAHNRGLSHGALTLSSVYVSPDVRVLVADFGVHRWLTASEGPASFVELAARDLLELGQLLNAAARSTLGSRNIATATEQSRAMDQLIADLECAGSTNSARDVQGRLGRMLLEVAGDSIRMVDERDGQQLARRSIVDELFEGETPLPQETRIQQSTNPTSSPMARLVVVVIIVAAIAGIIVFNGLL